MSINVFYWQFITTFQELLCFNSPPCMSLQTMANALDSIFGNYKKFDIIEKNLYYTYCQSYLIDYVHKIK